MTLPRKESYFEPPGLYVPALVPSPLPPPRTRRPPVSGTPTKPSTGRRKRPRPLYGDHQGGDS